MSLGRLAARTLIGGLFVGHGAQKLFGAFGGDGLANTAGFFESALGLRPGKRHATMAGATELGTGVLLVAGALTPVAAAGMTATMVTAIRKVHGPNGPWVTQSGWEYNAVLIAATAALADTGPGPFSVDEARFPDFHGPVVAALAVAAGVAGSYVATELLTDAPEPEATGPEGVSANGAGAAAPSSTAA